MILSIYHLTQSFVYFCLFISGRRAPFNISREAGLVVMNSLSFCLSEKAFIFHSDLKDTLAGQSILAESFYLSIFLIHHSTFSCPIEFLLRNLLKA